MHRFAKHSPLAASLLAALAGAMSLAQVLTVTIRGHRFGRIDDSLLPFTAAHYSRFFIVSLGLLLLYLSVQIYRRKTAAYWLVTCSLGLLIVTELADYKNHLQIGLYAATLTLLLATRRQYTVGSSNLSLRRGVLMAGTILLAVFIYASVGFATLSRHEVGTKLSAPVAMKYAAREVFTFQESQLPLRNRRARWFVASVNTAAVVAYGLALVSLFRPLRFQYGASRHDRELARRIIEKHSVSTEDFFKLWPADKHYYFSEHNDSVLAYKVTGSDALVLGGPSGNSMTFAGLLAAFADFANRNGWSVSYVSADERLGTFLSEGAFERLFIGNEAIIDTTGFAARTHRSKHFRYIRNRAERDELSFDYWQAPLSDKQLTMLGAVSDAWLRARGRREYTFALGYFDDEYLRQCDAAVLMRGGRAIAYANVLPSYIATARTIDHMRFAADMPPTGMHYLLSELILRLNADGVRQFNLGLAPLSGIDKREASTVPERLLAALKKLGGNYYSFDGLEQFKNKFEPEWQPRYLYYQGPSTRLLGLARNFSRAVSMPVASRGRRTAIWAMSIVAGLSYSSFLLAYLIAPRFAMDGLASALGSAGQRYAPLFNGLDIFSSLLLLTIAGMLWARLRSEARWQRLALSLLVLSAVGTALAAVTPLPAHIGSQLQADLHDLFSAIGVFGIGGAALVLTRQSRSRTLAAVFVSYLLALLISAFYHDSVIGNFAQRLQILLTSMWFVIVSIRLLRNERTRQ